MNDGTPRSHRLLPWSGQDGKPCYLSSHGDGLIDAMADEMEEMQLALGTEVLGHAGEMLAEDGAGERELRFLVQRMGEALRERCGWPSRAAGG